VVAVVVLGELGFPVGAVALHAGREGAHQLLGARLQGFRIPHGQVVHAEAFGDASVEALHILAGPHQGVHVVLQGAFLQAVLQLIHHQVRDGHAIGIGAIHASQAEGGPLHRDSGVGVDEALDGRDDLLGQLAGPGDALGRQPQFRFHGSS